ncbi:MAG: trypsin-like peptidase domain-containing protein [Crocinitomicaceae bacterium]|nr:trypsin-like peptidase domain-containing protein [Crocinitomicaceae bacterium]
MERCDAYLKNEMSDTDRAQFEFELNENPKLKSEFLFHKEFLVDLEDGAEYHEIRSTLRAIHKKPGVGDRNFFTSPQFLIPLALVASVALIVTIINPFVKSGEEQMSMALDTKTTNDQVQMAPTESAVTESTDSTSALFPTEMEMDETKNLAPEYIDPVQKVNSGNAFLIDDNGYFLTAKTAHIKNSRVVLQTSDKQHSFQVAVVYRDPENRFALLKCHPDVAEKFDSIPIRLFEGDMDTVKQVFVYGFDRGELTYTKADLDKELVKSEVYGDSSAFVLKLITKKSMAGSPVFTMDGQLIGLTVLIKYGNIHVTYLLDAHYIGTKLDYLQAEDPDLDWRTNYSPKAKTKAELMTAFKPFIFELHP